MAGLFFILSTSVTAQVLRPRAVTEPDFITARLLAGEASTIVPVITAFSLKAPAANLTEDQKALHLRGDVRFDRNFSGDTQLSDYGLGPVFNHRNCAGCHSKDGRGSLLEAKPGSYWTRIDVPRAVFLRMSVEDGSPQTFDAADLWGSPVPVPGFGTQLFHIGVPQVRAAPSSGSGLADVYFRYETRPFTYPDGRTVQLRKPIFKVENPYDGENSRLLQDDVRFGARATPQMSGLGLLEAIKEEDILNLAARDLSAWGIHGKPNWVLDRQKQLRGDIYPVSLGRFGLKANTPTIAQQALGALHGDIGVTNWMFPEESIAGSKLFQEFLPHWREGIEASAEDSEALIFYSQTLAVPARRDVDDPVVVAGARTFQRVGCTGCHQPSFTTGTHETIPQFSNQLIFPFTDMLLHDMGEELADGRRDFHAGGRDWKTRPLWTMGVVGKVNSLAGLLHDGRARNLEEAILWHGGEAAVSRNAFVNEPKENRDALIRFLKSL